MCWRMLAQKSGVQKNAPRRHRDTPTWQEHCEFIGFPTEHAWDDELIYIDSVRSRRQTVEIYSVLRPWRKSGCGLDPFLAPRFLRQHAPTRGNSYCFASWRHIVSMQKRDTPLPPHDGKPLNSCMLEDVGRPICVPKWSPKRHRNPPTLPKHIEFQWFGDDRTMCSCALICFPCLF